MTTERSLRTAMRGAAPVAGVLLASLLVWHASSAAFTSATVAPGNGFTAGTMVLTNNTGPGGAYAVSGGARFTVGPIKPGQSQQRCITVRSSGTLGGSLRFYTGNVAGTGLQNRLRIRVQRAALPTGTGPGTTVPATCTGFPGASATTIHNLFLPALPSSYGTANATFAVPNGSVASTAYRIRWTFVSTGTAAGDNALQGSSASADLWWEVR